MVVEDLHWIDPSSLELLDLTIERVANLPVLVLITFRPEYEAPWTGLSHVRSIALDRLAPAEIETLAEHVAGRPLPPAVTAQIVAKTDGVPLFVEELTRAVIEAGPGGRGAGRHGAAAVLRRARRCAPRSSPGSTGSARRRAKPRKSGRRLAENSPMSLSRASRSRSGRRPICKRR